MRIKNIRDSKDNINRVLIIGKGTIMAIIISIILLAIYGVILAYTALSESTMPIFVTAITIISITASAIYVSAKVDSKGWLNGAIAGLIYMVVLFLISLLFKTGTVIEKGIIVKIFIGFLVGGLAGMIGINLK
jgi:putative membrane protein (TIGR04086 family)